MKRVLRAWARAAALTTTLCSWAGAEPLDELTLARRALAHASLAPAQAARVAQAQALTTVSPATPTPRLAMRREESLGADTEFSTTVFGLEADLDLSGRVDRRREAGRATADALVHERRLARVQAICRARELALAAQQAEARAAARAQAHDELTGLVREIDQLVAGRERAAYDGERARQRLALHTLEQRVAEAETQRSKQALAAWVGAQAAAVDPAPVEPQWLADAIPQHPRLRALGQRVEGAAKARAVGERWWVPGLAVGAGVRLDEPQVGDVGYGYEALLTVDLPLVDRWAPQRAEADARRRQLEADLAAERARIEARVAALAGELAGYRSPLPEAGDFAARARLRYRRGVGPLSELFDALEAEEAMALARADWTNRRRSLRLQLACTVGAFPEAALMELVE